MNTQIPFRRKIRVDSIDPDSVITYSIALMMGVMFFNHTNALASICYFLALAAWVFKWIREKKVLIEWDLPGIILLLILADALLSAIFSYDVKYSFREFRGEIAKMVPFYFLIRSNIKTNDALKKILKAISIEGMINEGFLSKERIDTIHHFGLKYKCLKKILALFKRSY